MKESKFVKTKIFAGYAILIAVCVLSVGYVYRTVVRFSTPDGSFPCFIPNAASRDKRSITFIRPRVTVS